MNGIAYGYYVWSSIPLGGHFRDCEEADIDGFGYIYAYFQCGM
mgnify:CR=1 FL=1|jgi:hypothetical protein